MGPHETALRQALDFVGAGMARDIITELLGGEAKDDLDNAEPSVLFRTLVLDESMPVGDAARVYNAAVFYCGEESY